MLYRAAGALLALLALTVALSFMHLGDFGFAVALAIATVKALLVLAFFMELRTSTHLLWLMAAAGVIWLMLLLGGTLADVATRVPVTP